MPENPNAGKYGIVPPTPQQIRQSQPTKSHVAREESRRQHSASYKAKPAPTAGTSNYKWSAVAHIKARRAQQSAPKQTIKQSTQVKYNVQLKPKVAQPPRRPPPTRRR